MPAEDVAVYILSACDGGAQSCVAGSDAQLAGQSETVTYTATNSERVYLYVDSFSSRVQGGFSLDVNVQ